MTANRTSPAPGLCSSSLPTPTESEDLFVVHCTKYPKADYHGSGGTIQVPVYEPISAAKGRDKCSDWLGLRQVLRARA